MKISKLITALIIGILVFSQVSTAFAGSTNEVVGSVQGITLETDPTTGLTTVLVDVLDTSGVQQVIRLSLETAVNLGLVTLDGDGNPIINEAALGTSITIDPSLLIPEDKQHPVGSALSTFFSDIEGLDYAAIMEAHEQGYGFGVIAQVLWLTKKLDGDASVFFALLDAKKSGDFSEFILPDGTTPQSWGQLKKAILDGAKKGNLGVAMSGKSNNGNSNGNENGNKDKDKDKTNNAGGNGNGNGKK